MRIVVVSSGHIARTFAEDLSQGHDVVVVQDGEEGRAELEQLDVELLDGAGNDVEVLRRARANEADFLVACSHYDEMNILACLTARQLGGAQTICFVSNAS